MPRRKKKPSLDVSINHVHHKQLSSKVHTFKMQFILGTPVIPYSADMTSLSSETRRGIEFLWKSTSIKMVAVLDVPLLRLLYLQLPLNSLDGTLHLLISSSSDGARLLAKTRMASSSLVSGSHAPS